MKCFHCQAQLKRDTATFTDSRKGYVIVLHEVPAWVCPQCGEPMFDHAAVNGIQDVLKAIDDRIEKLSHAA
jgi:YgiT-type zinc finger domain-containing protein